MQNYGQFFQQGRLFEKCNASLSGALSVLFREPVRSAQKLELAVLNHCFARVCTTWSWSSILDFLRFARSKSSLILGLDSSCLNEQSNES